MHFSIHPFHQVLICFLFKLSLIFSIGVGLSVPVAQAREGPCPVGPNPQWTGIEKQVWGTICSGQQAGLPQTGDVKQQVISKRFLEAILRDPKYGNAIGPRGVSIKGAHIEDLFDLSYVTVSYPLEFVDCKFEKAVTLRALRSDHHIEFDGSTFLADLDLSQIRVKRVLSLTKGTFQGVLLQGAHIEGQLQAGDSIFNGAIQMSAITTSGSVMLRSANFKGDVDIHASSIGGNLSIQNTVIPHLLTLNGTHVLGRVHLGGTFMDTSSKQVNKPSFFKIVDFTKARIDHGLTIADSIIEDKLALEGIRIGGALTITGANFFNAKTIEIGHSHLESLNISHSVLSSLDLTGTVIHNELALESIRWMPNAKLTLLGAETKSINDKVDTWPDRLDLRGFVYAGTYALGTTGSDDFPERNVGWFKSWLSKQTPYSPQPYKQLASVLNSAGHREKAEQILIENKEHEWLFTRNFRSPAWWSLTFQKCFIGYGYRSIFFPMMWAIGFSAFGCILLFLSQNPFKDPQAPPPTSFLPLFLERQFSVRWSSRINQSCAIFVYSLDRFLPLVRLREHIRPPIQPSGWLSYWFHFQQLMGYVVTAFFVAGLSGLVER